MDKFLTYKLIRIFVCLFCLAEFHSVAVAQESINWSFEEHPYDFSNENIEQTNSVFDALREQKISQAERCRFQLDYKFSLYEMLYPEFRNAGSRADRMQAWLEYRHNVEAVELVCLGNIFSSNIRLIMKMDTESDLSYCGKFSRTPETPLEQMFVDEIQRNIIWLNRGNWSVKNALLHRHDVREGERRISWIKLNADVLYYLLASDDLSLSNLDHEKSMAHAKSLLDAERVAFVEGALKEKNFQSVLDSTAECVSN